MCYKHITLHRGQCTVKYIHSKVTYHLSVAELLQLSSSQIVSVENYSEEIEASIVRYPQQKVDYIYILSKATYILSIKQLTPHDCIKIPCCMYTLCSCRVAPLHGHQQQECCGIENVLARCLHIIVQMQSCKKTSRITLHSPYT